MCYVHVRPRIPRALFAPRDLQLNAPSCWAAYDITYSIQISSPVHSEAHRPSLEILIAGYRDERTQLNGHIQPLYLVWDPFLDSNEQHLAQVSGTR